jgi:hypothetical protein
MLNRLVLLRHQRVIQHGCLTLMDEFCFESYVHIMREVTCLTIYNIESFVSFGALLFVNIDGLLGVDK